MLDPEQITPDEDDGFISDQPRGYSVALEGRSLGSADDMDEAVGMLVDRFILNDFYPNVWYVNDHGNVTLLLITFEDEAGRYTWDFTDVAYA